MFERYLEISGSYRECGRQAGRYLREQIRTNYRYQELYWKNAENYEFADWGKTAERYLPLLRKWTPEVLEEMEGMAEGAELPFEMILSLAAAYEKSFDREETPARIQLTGSPVSMGRIGEEPPGRTQPLPSEKCTSFLIAGSEKAGQPTLIGQTNDEDVRLWADMLDVIIRYSVSETTECGKLSEKEPLGVLVYTHPGIPAYMGMNSRGLGVTWTYINNGKAGFGVPTNVMIRHLLNLSNVEEALEFLKAVPHDVPNQFGIGDRSGRIASVECFPGKVYVKEDSVLIHANHNAFAPEPECSGSKYSWNRYRVMERQVREAEGVITAEKAEEFLKNHEGYPGCICSHPEPEKPWHRTMAAMVFDLTAGKMHLAFGNACQETFETYHFL